MKQNAGKSSKVSNITEATRGSLETWLEADRKLYDHFVQKINVLIDRSGLGIKRIITTKTNFPSKIWKGQDVKGCHNATETECRIKV